MILENIDDWSIVIFWGNAKFGRAAVQLPCDNPCGCGNATARERAARVRQLRFTGEQVRPLGHEGLQFPFDLAARAVEHGLGALYAFDRFVAHRAVEK